MEKKIKSVSYKGKPLKREGTLMFSYNEINYLSENFILENPLLFAVEYESSWELKVPSYEELQKGFVIDWNGIDWVATLASNFDYNYCQKSYLANLWSPTQTLAEKSLKYNQAKVKLNSLAEYCNGLFEENGEVSIYLCQGGFDTEYNTSKWGINNYGLKFSSEQSAEKFLELIPADLKETLIEMIKEKYLI